MWVCIFLYVCMWAHRFVGAHYRCMFVHVEPEADVRYPPPPLLFNLMHRGRPLNQTQSSWIWPALLGSLLCRCCLCLCRLEWRGGLQDPPVLVWISALVLMLIPQAL